MHKDVRKFNGKVANGLAFTKSAKLDKTFRHRYPDSNSSYYAPKKTVEKFPQKFFGIGIEDSSSKFQYNQKQKKVVLKVTDGKKAVAVQKVSAVPEKQVSFEKEARVYPIRSIPRQIFSTVAQTAAVVFATVISIFGLGHVLTGTANGQDKPKVKTEQPVDSKQTWGSVKARFTALGETKGNEKKANGKTWIEKVTPGAKKFDITYVDGVLTFKKLDGRKDFSYSLINSKSEELKSLAKTPLRLVWFTKSDGIDGVCLGYDYGMAFFAPKVVNEEATVDVKMITPSDKGLSSNALGSR